jgi:hypothetical protein
LNRSPGGRQRYVVELYSRRVRLWPRAEQWIPPPRNESPHRTASLQSDPVTSVLDPASAVGQRERRESATDMRLDGDEMAADADLSACGEPKA